MKKCLGWHFECCARRVPTLRESAAHRIKKRTSKYKKCFLLRLQFLLSLLYCTQQHRPMSERRARERPKNTSTSKVHFLNIAILKRLTHFLTQVTPFLKQLSSCISFAFLRTLSMPLCLLAAGAPITLTCGVMVC